MRTINILLMAMGIVVLPGAGFAEDYYDCKLTCAAERDSRNANCPSPYDSSYGGQTRTQCMTDNQSAYEDCVKRCPTPPASPTTEEKTTPPAMGY